MTDKHIIPRRMKLDTWDKDDGSAAASRTDKIRGEGEISPAGVPCSECLSGTGQD